MVSFSALTSLFLTRSVSGQLLNACAPSATARGAKQWHVFLSDGDHVPRPAPHRRSHYLMNGGSLLALSKQLGHADTRMTIRHYGHLADKWRAEEARRHAPTYGLGVDRKVAQFRRR